MTNDQKVKKAEKIIRSMEKSIDRAFYSYQIKLAAGWSIAAMLFFFVASVALTTLTLDWPPVPHPGWVMSVGLLASFASAVKSAWVFKFAAERALHIPKLREAIKDRKILIEQSLEKWQLEEVVKMEGPDPDKKIKNRQSTRRL